MHRRPRCPLPDCPPGENPFRWITRTAPMVREARRAIAEGERRALDYARAEAAKPALRAHQPTPTLAHAPAP